MSGSYQYKPGNKLSKWFDDRLPIVRLLNETLTFFPTPRNLNIWWIFGVILSFNLVIMILTGITLAMHYNPSTEHAFASVEHIMRDVNYGWLLRYVHANGASMFFIAAYLHILRGMYYGSYRAPRELLWIIGVVIYVVMMAVAFLGYVLPWGQMSYWGATVITSLFSAVPLVGGVIVEWLWGGFSVGNATLNRFFVLHFLLPFVLIALVILHLWALHVPGNNNPTGVDVKNPQTELLPFHPYYTSKDLFAIVLFMIFFALMVFYRPNYLGDAVNYVQADPLQTPAHIVPEWYFLPFYAILRAIPDKLLGVLGMFGAILVWTLLPWLDRSPTRALSYRPLQRNFFYLYLADFVMLGFAGSKEPEGVWLYLAQIGVFYYFAYFLVILPLVSRMEKPLPVPDSIEASIRNKEVKLNTPRIQTQRSGAAQG